MISPIKQVAQSSVRGILRIFGIGIDRISRFPKETLIGLSHRPIKTVIDCGANQGQFARYISRFFPQAELLCFEPLMDPFRDLEVWAGTQHGRVKCFNLALGEKDDTAVMYHHVDHAQSSSILSTTEHEAALFPQTLQQVGVSVIVRSLDSVIGSRLNGLESEILLKLDVQGYEDRVLRGAKKLLRVVDACLLEVCIDPLYRDQASFVDLVSFLSEQGLQYAGNLDQVYGEDGRVMWFDALFTRNRI